MDRVFSSTVQILRPDLRDAGRILVTSDIHGHADHLKEVLKKADFGGNDRLIVVGDLLEKGPDSLGTLRFVMDLCAQGRALTLWGNVDYLRVYMMEKIKKDPAAAEDFMEYLREMRAWKGTSFFDELCRELGRLPQSPEDILHILPAIGAHFAPELDFLCAQPTIIETPNYRFVHGGLRHTELQANLTLHPHDLMKYDNFLAKARREGVRQEKYTVVGHWPVALNREDYPNFNPIIDTETRIIAIDGGCGLKAEGQLNLLILPSADCPAEAITHVYYDGFPTMTAPCDQAPSEDPFYIHWGDADVRFLQREGNMAEVEHVRTGRRMWVSADCLYKCADVADLQTGDTAVCDDSTDYRLPIHRGDTLSVIQKTTRGILVKKDGIVGWLACT